MHVVYIVVSCVLLYGTLYEMDAKTFGDRTFFDCIDEIILKNISVLTAVISIKISIRIMFGRADRCLRSEILS